MYSIKEVPRGGRGRVSGKKLMSWEGGPLLVNYLSINNLRGAFILILQADWLQTGQ